MNTEIKEYKFKCGRWEIVGFAVFSVLFIAFLSVSSWLNSAVYPVIVRLVGNTGNLNVSGAIMAILFFATVILIWNISFTLMQYDGSAVLHKDYMVLHLKEERLIRYNQIGNVYSVGVLLCIALKNGDLVVIKPVLKFNRNIVTMIRLSRGIERRWKGR
ncbi:MAG: hypothetical protein FWG65_04340 [Turicibacter sp.]|nr:hypothetical protein [Turicibacter sp.]